MYQPIDGEPLPAGHDTSDFIISVVPSTWIVPSYPPDLPEPEIVGAFYDAAAEAIARDLAGGRDVALLCLGDPLLYGSFVYVLDRLKDRFAFEVVPGITWQLSPCSSSTWSRDRSSSPGTAPS